MKIAIIGDGGWGTANALLLTGYGHEVSVWGASADHVADIARSRRNDRYLPGVELPPCIRWTADRATAVQDADMVVLATPSKYFGDVCASFAGLVPPDKLAVSLTKGFCEKTHARMSELARTALGVSRVAVLSGPTHAEEVARGIPTAIVAAADDLADARAVQDAWNGPAFRVYTSDDPVGVDVGTYSSPYAEPTRQHAVSVVSQDGRRLPRRRPERFWKITVRADYEVDALVAATNIAEVN